MLGWEWGSASGCAGREGAAPQAVQGGRGLDLGKMWGLEGTVNGPGHCRTWWALGQGAAGPGEGLMGAGPGREGGWVLTPIRAPCPQGDAAHLMLVLVSRV